MLRRLKNGKKIKEQSVEFAEVHRLLGNLNGTPVDIDHREYGFSPRKEVTTGEQAQDILTRLGHYAHYTGIHRVYRRNNQQTHSIYLEASLVIGGKVYKPVIEKATLEYTVNIS